MTKNTAPARCDLRLGWRVPEWMRLTNTSRATVWRHVRAAISRWSTSATRRLCRAPRRSASASSSRNPASEKPGARHTLRAFGVLENSSMHDRYSNAAAHAQCAAGPTEKVQDGEMPDLLTEGQRSKPHRPRASRSAMSRATTRRSTTLWWMNSAAMSLRSAPTRAALGVPTLRFTSPFSRISPRRA